MAGRRAECERLGSEAPTSKSVAEHMPWAVNENVSEDVPDPEAQPMVPPSHRLNSVCGE